LQEHAKPIYTIKAAEAQRVLTGQPSKLLQAEAKARGVSVQELASTILQKNRDSLPVLGNSEAWAYKAKEALSLARDADEIVQILSQEGG
jgi:hypothetical protein